VSDNKELEQDLSMVSKKSSRESWSEEGEFKAQKLVNTPSLSLSAFLYLD
jgi:hypothetical protein